MLSPHHGRFRVAVYWTLASLVLLSNTIYGLVMARRSVQQELSSTRRQVPCRRVGVGRACHKRGAAWRARHECRGTSMPRALDLKCAPSTGGQGAASLPLH